MAALVAMFPFGNGAVSAPWLTALLLVAAGAVTVWRLGGVRLAETDEGALLVRNVVTTQRLAPDPIDRLDVARSFIDSSGDTFVVVADLRTTGHWSLRRRVRCSATLTFSVGKAGATTAALAAWAGAHGVRCDVDPYRLMSGSGQGPISYGVGR